ncbi:endonuclease III domain-containing protein [Haloplanus aerogenes]|uniref:Endonuclease III n=1 Tax=Haloplanus aerogenes TaxID=660522 RepID=A0A3M0CWP2_9EURY|nr:endonuclease III [Haloplanus aerogenes]AZH25115.1 endonuclease III [Haloplanus aerogenes]RMB13662.1 endonuclease-3 [Haloplanus aerogenes]
MPDEPAENVSGGTDGGGVEARFATGSPDTRAEAVVDALGGLYWQKAYGGREAFPCLVRTILSQNTSDTASQPAFDALLERYDGGEDPRSSGNRPEADDSRTQSGDGGDLAATLAAADRETLADTIASAGLYNQKSRVIVEAAEEIVADFGGAAAFHDFVREGDPSEVRDRLLDIHGVGPKTADCVLLFAGGRDGVFPVDTHVHRIARRMGLAPPDADHEGVREALEASVPSEKCGFGHTATIQFGREYCTARKPACLDGPEACPLYELCDRVGVDANEKVVVDPAKW